MIWSKIPLDRSLLIRIGLVTGFIIARIQIDLPLCKIVHLSPLTSSLLVQNAALLYQKFSSVSNTIGLATKDSSLIWCSHIKLWQIPWALREWPFKNYITSSLLEYDDIDFKISCWRCTIHQKIFLLVDKYTFIGHFYNTYHLILLCNLMLSI